MLIEVLYQCLKNYSHCAYYINILQRAAFKDISISTIIYKKICILFSENVLHVSILSIAQVWDDIKCYTGFVFSFLLSSFLLEINIVTCRFHLFAYTNFPTPSILV